MLLAEARRVFQVNAHQTWLSLFYRAVYKAKRLCLPTLASTATLWKSSLIFSFSAAITVKHWSVRFNVNRKMSLGRPSTYIKLPLPNPFRPGSSKYIFQRASYEISIPLLSSAWQGRRAAGSHKIWQRWNIGNSSLCGTDNSTEFLNRLRNILSQRIFFVFGSFITNAFSFFCLAL